MSWVSLALLGLMAAPGGLQSKGEEDESLPTFTDVTGAAGIHFKHSYGDHELSNIVEGTGPGACVFDFDGDGYLDIYFLNGCWQKGVNDNRGRDLRNKLFNALYHNNGDGSFTDVTSKAGVGHAGFGMGASAADYDNDGDVDLYVLNYGPNVLYRNDGDGTFSDVTDEAGLADPLWSLSGPWFDYDRDGDLDLYVVNYIEYDAGRFRDYYAAKGYPGPLSYNGEPDHFYRNNGDGTFSDATEDVGILNAENRGMSAVATDLDNDGWIDVYVANDAMPNSFYLNDGKGQFTEEAMLRGLAFGEGGQGASSMGPVVADVDRNGLLDVYVPDMGYGALLLNRKGIFEDVTTPSNLAVVCGQYTGWGGGLFDYDNDGWIDLFVANGNPHHEYTEEDVLMRNDGKGAFIDVADRSGPYFRKKFVGRGAAFADFDNDGDLDLLVLNLNDRPVLLRNDGGNRGNWLTVVPKTAGDRRDALGARVTVTAGGVRQFQDVFGVRGYLSQSDYRAHFGLAQADRVDEVRIRWPDGSTKVLENVAVNQILTVIEEPE